MKRNVLIAGAVAVVVIILAWWFFLYAPTSDELSTTNEDVAAAEAQTNALQAELSQLKDQQENAVAQEALLGELNAAIPQQADLAEFIIQARQIADNAGIDFLSIAPSPPAPSGTGTLSVISLNITLDGSFFQVKNYLTELEELDRLVIIDTINIAAGSSDGASTGDGTTLSVTLVGRMFTQAQPAGTAAVPTDPNATTTSSTTPTDSSSSSTSGSSVPSGSSTTGGT